MDKELKFKFKDIDGTILVDNVSAKEISIAQSFKGTTTSVPFAITERAQEALSIWEMNNSVSKRAKKIFDEMKQCQRK